MSIEFFPGVGLVHLQTVKKARVVPADERHRWLNKHLLRGQRTTCDKCSCEKHYRRDYETRYRMPGGPEVSERPACTGGKPALSPSVVGTTSFVLLGLLNLALYLTIR